MDNVFKEKHVPLPMKLGIAGTYVAVFYAGLVLGNIGSHLSKSLTAKYIANEFGGEYIKQSLLEYSDREMESITNPDIFIPFSSSKSNIYHVTKDIGKHFKNTKEDDKKIDFRRFV